VVGSRRRRALLGMVLVVSLVAAACGGDDEDEGTSGTTGGADKEEVREGGEIAFAAEQDPTGFNNLTSKDNLAHLRYIMQHVWPYAYRALPDLSVEPTPTLADEAEVVSEEPFTVEWKIAEEAIWDDDTPVSSDDFQWVWQSCNGKVDAGEPTTKDEETGQDVTALDCASTAGYDVSTFEKVDEKTFRLEFEGPYVEYEGLFGDPIPPSHLGKKLPDGWNTGFDASPLASAGPYKLKEWSKGAFISLERNPKYWGPKANLETLVYRQIPDASTHADTLRNDEVQIIYPQPQVDLFEQLQTVAGIKAEANFGPAWEHLDFNFKNELLAIKEVRQAIAYGLDRDSYVTTLMKPFSDEASRLDNRTFVSNSPYYEVHGQEYAKRDVAKATAALEKAGFVKGADGVYAKDGKKASFRLRVRTPNPLREELEQLIQADLKEVGIDVRIENFGPPDSIGKVGAAGDFDLFIFAWIGTPFAVQGAQQIFASDSDSNFGKYNSPEFDAGIKEAGTLLDKDERAKKLNELDEMLWEDLPNIPLFQKPAGVLAYQDRYANVTDNTSTESFFWNAVNWGLRATAS
jgi:peptide/nickel transport system substrate-binding protein